jgi:hypothetical protein
MLVFLFSDYLGLDFVRFYLIDIIIAISGIPFDTVHKTLGNPFLQFSLNRSLKSTQRLHHRLSPKVSSYIVVVKKLGSRVLLNYSTGT